MYKKDFLLAVMEEFYFLIELGYNNLQIDMPAWEKEIRFKSPKLKREILFYGEYDSLRVVISKFPHKFFLKGKQVYMHELLQKENAQGDYSYLAVDDANYNKSLHECAELMKKYLMPVIKGEKWINP